MRSLVFGAAKMIGWTIVVVMAFNATIGTGDTRALAVTTATVGGQSADIVITDMLPAFFDSIGDDDSGKE